MIVLKHYEMQPTKNKATVIEHPIEIVYYTDPLCCWSWAFQPHWERFVTSYKAFISYTHCLGGMVADWRFFQDPMQDVKHPSQMGPVWLYAQQQTGVRLNERIWVDDPPHSSYPACLAVKAAQLQSDLAGERYLKEIQHAVMLNVQNIAKVPVLMTIAQQLEARFPDEFCYHTFLEDFTSTTAKDAFREDLKKTRYHEITRFPTLTFSKGQSPGVMITGFRPYEVLLEAFYEVAPELRTLSNLK